MNGFGGYRVRVAGLGVKLSRLDPPTTPYEYIMMSIYRQSTFLLISYTNIL